MHLSFFLLWISTLAFHLNEIKATSKNENTTEEYTKALLEVVSTTNPEEIYELGSIIGSGKRGLVQRAIQRETGALFAIKSYPCNKNRRIVSTRDEVNMRDRGLTYPNILQYKEGYYYNGKCWIVMEYIHGITLKKLKSLPLSDHAIMRLISQAVYIMKILAKAHICHGDMHKNNFMVKYDGHLVLIDFSAAFVTLSDKSIKQPFQKQSSVCPDWHRLYYILKSFAEKMKNPSLRLFELLKVIKSFDSKQIDPNHWIFNAPLFQDKGPIRIPQGYH